MTGRRMGFAAGLAALPLALGACGLTDLDARVGELEAQYERWLAQRPDAYEYELHRRCPCPDEVKRPTRIRVDGEAVVEARDVETGAALAEAGPRSISIDDIFEHVIDHTSQRDAHISISFDPTFNFPVEAHGWIGGRLQDEFLFEVTEFEPDP